jgi:16S rRNA processing protein RimM
MTVEGWVELASVMRAHGVRGVLKLHLFHDDTDSFRPGVSVRIGDVLHTVVAFSKTAGLLTVEGITDKDAADALKRQPVLVQRADFVADEDEVFLIDQIGKSVVDESGRVLGVVAGFADNTAQLLLEVTAPDGTEVLVPFVEPIVVEVGGDRIVVRPPGGLFPAPE